MASGFFALFDDIATLLDDVASMSKDVGTMSKVATKKTAGILGDDLAVNAEKASGFASKRELPVLLAIAKGSFLNKAIILPLIFLLSAFLPIVIKPLLIIGGAYLAFEGAEKIYEFIFHKPKKIENEKPKQLDVATILTFEKKKIKSAILVDFILSLEIVIIALDAVINETLTDQIIVVSIVAILATIGVYGIVAIIVRMDDFGFALIKRNKTIITRSIGQILVKALPLIIKSLTIIGTFAMLLVAGGIFVHKIHYLGTLMPNLPSIIAEFLMGTVIGVALLMIVKSISYIFGGNKIKGDKIA